MLILFVLLFKKGTFYNITCHVFLLSQLKKTNACTKVSEMGGCFI